MHKKLRLRIFIIIVLSINIFPVLFGCIYGLPSADDFSNTIGWRQWSGNHIIYLFHNMISMYMNWQGTYLGYILGSFPMYYVLGIKGLRVWLLLTAIGFLLAFVAFSLNSIKRFGFCKNDERETALLFGTLGLSYIFSSNMLDETFYWYTGTCVYTIPLIFALLSITWYFKYEKEQNKRYLILGVIAAICGAGGALNISALLCAILLFSVLHNLIAQRTISRSVVIPISALLGSVINAVAPGNFARHEIFDTELRLMTALYYSIRRAGITIISDFEGRILILIVIVTFIWAYNRLQDSKYLFKHPILVSIYGCFGIVVTDFPVALGYSGIDFPQRAVFIERISILVFIMLCTIYWAGWAADKKVFNFTKETLFVLAFICVIPMSTLNQFTPVKMCVHMLKGDYKTAVLREENIIEQIKKSENMDVIIECKKPSDGEWSNMKKLGLEEGSESWVNNTIAHYYGKNSITIRYLEEN